MNIRHRCPAASDFVGLTSGLARPDGEIAEEGALRFAAHGFEAGEQLEEVSAAEFERVLVGLVGGADGVIDERRRGLFDVAAYDVRYRARRGEFDEAARAGFVGGKSVT